MAEPIANLGLEQAVLGTMLMYQDAAAKSHMLAPNDFAYSEHAQIFEAISAAVADNRTATPVTLAPHFAGMQFKDFTGAQYLGHLVAKQALPVLMLDGFIAELRDYAARRTLQMLGEEMIAAAKNAGVSVKSACAGAMNTIDNISAISRTHRRTSFDVGDIAAENIMQLKDRRKPDMIRTGLVDLDRTLGGWHRGEMTIIGARPSMGKSALIFSTSRQAAKHGTSSLIFSLEMRRETVVNRMLSDMVWNSHSPIPYERIMRQDVTDYEIERLGTAAETFSTFPIRIDDQAGLTIAEIVARARRYADELAREGKRLDVIAVDHMGKIKPSDRYAGQPVREVGEKTNALFDLGRELDVAMIVAVQLNRSTEKRENKRAEMSDPRDSGNIEEDADNMLFPYRAAYYLETQKEDDEQEDLKRIEKLNLCKNTLEINITKNRNGARKNIEFYCDMASNVVRDLA